MSCAAGGAPTISSRFRFYSSNHADRGGAERDLEANPRVAFTLFKAFSEAKDLAMADLTQTSALPLDGSR
jgi:hypothetical protein